MNWILGQNWTLVMNRFKIFLKCKIFHCKNYIFLSYSPSTPVSSSRGSTLTWRWTNQRTDMPTSSRTTIPESCSLLLTVCHPPVSSLPTAILILHTASTAVSVKTSAARPHHTFKWYVYTSMSGYSFPVMPIRCKTIPFSNAEASNQINQSPRVRVADEFLPASISWTSC